MKKLLFSLLLISSLSNAQALFDKGVKITGGITTDNSATKVVVQSANNVLNTISKTELQDAFYFATASALPVVGITDKLYITRDDNKLYRFNGTIYVPLSADVSGKEDIANKQNSLAVDATNLKYPTVTAVNAGLATKQNAISGTTNVVPKFGTGGVVASNITDNGTLVTLNSSSKITGPLSFGNANPSQFIMIDSNGFALSGATNTIGLRIRPTIGSDSVTSYAGISSTPFTTTSAFNVGNIFHFTVNTIGLGAGSSATNQYGFFIPNSFTTASNNYAIRSQIPLGVNNWNLYMDGAAKNYLAGRLLLGSTTDDGINMAQFNGTVKASPAVTDDQVPNLGQVTSGLNLKANIASPTFTGTPSAPTAPIGTNTTQLATTAFVLANTQPSIPQLEYNNTDLTVWNNGKGNIDSNTSFGSEALNSNTTGSGNTAIGANALDEVTSNSNNTGLGTSAMQLNNSGSDNVAIGYNAGRFDNLGDGINQVQSVLIGSRSKGTRTSTNEIAIGYNVQGSGSNTATIGNTSITKTVLRGVIQQTTYTVATLPAGSIGQFAIVTDAVSPTYLGTLTGGGSVVCPVFFNGTSWVSH